MYTISKRVGQTNLRIQTVVIYYCFLKGDIYSACSAWEAIFFNKIRKYGSAK